MKSVWNPVDFMKSVWNLADFMKSTPNLVKSEEFLLKHLISWWNPPDFMVKSARFHEICWISWISWWNPPDFTDFMKSAGFHVKSAGFHEMWAFAWWIKYRSFYRKTKQRNCLQMQLHAWCCSCLEISWLADKPNSKFFLPVDDIWQTCRLQDGQSYSLRYHRPIESVLFVQPVD